MHLFLKKQNTPKAMWPKTRIRFITSSQHFGDVSTFCITTQMLTKRSTTY